MLPMLGRREDQVLRALGAGLLAWALLLSGPARAEEGAVARTVGAAEPAAAKSLLMLYGGSQRSALQDIFNRVLHRELAGTNGGRVEIFDEYLDEARFPGSQNEERFAQFLHDRYSGRHIDVVMTAESNALRFLARHRDMIFPGTPVVCLISKPAIDTVNAPPDFVAITADLDPAPTMRLALALRPQARELVAVVGSSEVDRAFEDRIRATPLPEGVKLRVLSGPIGQIERELATLGPRSVVVTSAFRRDGAGQTFPSMYFLYDRLHAVATAPMFHIIDHVVGRGAVGTSSVPLEEIAREGAVVAAQLLDGTPLASVRLPEAAQPTPIVDAREMRRWNIDESLLPAGTVVRFREVTLWQQYRKQLAAIGLLLLVETVLVGALLVQRGRRHRVEVRLRHSEQTMRLAGGAAQLVMWNWDIGRDRIWTSADDAADAKSGARNLESFMRAVHPDDKPQMQRAVQRALAGDGLYETEYRVVEEDGTIRWRAGRGRVEHGKDEGRWLCGVTMDITQRKAAELEAMRQRNELAHLSRVMMLGELTSSVAHELNQPLMAILSNAEAAQISMQRGRIDPAELAAILDDIVENDKRAGEIIWSMRKMLKKEQRSHELFSANDLVVDVLRLMRSDLMTRGVTLETELAAAAPTISGDRVQLQQVLINLVLNACDAMASNPKEERVLRVSTGSGGGLVNVVVSDRGCGIPPQSLDSVFKPFFTTKAHGLGLGLSVCSSIVSSHGGRLRAVNNPGAGATFILELAAVAMAVA